MKIGLVTTLLDEKITGVGKYVYRLAKTLTEIDKENEYIFIHRIKNDNEIYRHGKEFFVPSLPTGPLRNIAENIVLARNEDKFDIVHEPFLGLFIKSKFKKIVTIHDLASLYFRFDSPISFDLYFRLFMPRVLRIADAILAVSESTRNDIIKNYKIEEEKVITVYSGVDEKHVDSKVIKSVETKFSIDYNFILFVGTPMRRKNLEVAITAFNEIKKIGFNHKFIIAGKKENEYKNLIKLTKKLGLEDEVLFTGYLNEDEITALYKLSSLFIYPSLYEGFGFPLLEAMAQGTVVACSNVSSMPEIAGGACIAFDPMDINDIAVAMKKGLTDEELRKELIERGKKRVRLFSWENCAKNVLEIYNKVGKRL